MPAPTVAGVGAGNSGVGGVTISLPAITFQAGDVNLLIAESVGGQNYTTPGGWAHVDAVSPVVQGVNTQLTVFWRRWQSGDGSVSLPDSGNHNVGRIITIRGCPASGNPWNVIGFAVDATSDNSALFPTATTTVADCLVLLIGAWSDDMTVAAAPVNANLTSITEHIDTTTTSGDDGAIYLASGIKTTSGAIGTSTATLSGVAFKAMMTLAMAPAAVAARPQTGISSAAPSATSSPRRRAAHSGIASAAAAVSGVAAKKVASGGAAPAATAGGGEHDRPSVVPPPRRVVVVTHGRRRAGGAFTVGNAVGSEITPPQVSPQGGDCALVAHVGGGGVRKAAPTGATLALAAGVGVAARKAPQAGSTSAASTVGSLPRKRATEAAAGFAAVPGRSLVSTSSAVFGQLSVVCASAGASLKRAATSGAAPALVSGGSETSAVTTPLLPPRVVVVTRPTRRGTSTFVTGSAVGGPLEPPRTAEQGGVCGVAAAGHATPPSYRQAVRVVNAAAVRVAHRARSAPNTAVLDFGPPRVLTEPQQLGQSVAATSVRATDKKVARQGGRASVTSAPVGGSAKRAANAGVTAAAAAASRSGTAPRPVLGRLGFAAAPQSLSAKAAAVGGAEPVAVVGRATPSRRQGGVLTAAPVSVGAQVRRVPQAGRVTAAVSGVRSGAAARPATGHATFAASPTGVAAKRAPQAGHADAAVAAGHTGAAVRAQSGHCATGLTTAVGALSKTTTQSGAVAAAAAGVQSGVPSRSQAGRCAAGVTAVAAQARRSSQLGSTTTGLSSTAGARKAAIGRGHCTAVTVGLRSGVPIRSQAGHSSLCGIARGVQARRSTGQSGACDLAPSARGTQVRRSTGNGGRLCALLAVSGAGGKRYALGGAAHAALVGHSTPAKYTALVQRPPSGFVPRPASALVPR